MTGFVWCNWSP